MDLDDWKPIQLGDRHGTRLLSVPGGWIYCIADPNQNEQIVFVPDPGGYSAWCTDVASKALDEVEKIRRERDRWADEFQIKDADAKHWKEKARGLEESANRWYARHESMRKELEGRILELEQERERLIRTQIDDTNDRERTDAEIAGLKRQVTELERANSTFRRDKLAYADREVKLERVIDAMLGHLDDMSPSDELAAMAERVRRRLGLADDWPQSAVGDDASEPPEANERTDDPR